MKLAEIADRLSCQLDGDGEIEIYGVASLEDAENGYLSFFTNTKYLQKALSTKASAIIVDKNFTGLEIPLLKSSNPYLTFAKAIEFFYPQEKQVPHLHPSAFISDKAMIGKGVSVGAHSFIDEGVVLSDGVSIETHCAIHKNVRIGKYTKIHSGSVIRQGVVIGSLCIIHSNSVIGSDGFGYAKQDDGTWYKIVQTGSVVIEDEVEIGACSTLDRATLGNTKVSSGVKIDNLVQIGHGSKIGSNSLLCAQVGLAGSTIVGKNVILAGQVGVSGHLTIGDNVMASGQTGIPSSVEPDTFISGSPAIEHRLWMKSSALFARLPEWMKMIREMDKRLKSLESTFNATHELEKDISLKGNN